MKFPVYIDNLATTPVDPRVVDAMMPFLHDKFGNVGSAHYCGRDVLGPVAEARGSVARLLGAKADEIVFTSGATESDNLAIKGAASANYRKGRHIITGATEHKAVLDSCEYLEKLGFEITILPVDEFGRITPEQVSSAIRHGKEGTKDKTILVSLMAANNEIGTLHPIKEISRVTREHDVLFHVDAAQMVSKLPFDVKDVDVDLVSISAHKMYGPKGIGALYVKKDGKEVPLDSQMHGGGQEGGLRSGTLAVPMVVAIGKAAELAWQELDEERVKLTALRSQLWNGLSASIDGLVINGHPTDRMPGNLSVTFPGVDAEMLVLRSKNICFSATSACSSQSTQASHVLKAIGKTDKESAATLRFGLGRFNNASEMDYVIEWLTDQMKK
ncbi:MAG: IscS subfamily cysteine desulfurase [Zetaproteobacteria bacterium]|nr:IscS subfamily cysteine desulfurase [Pseudobdellovibrionaceae bacterium]